MTFSRDKESVFEVIGMLENVDRAREEIEAYIVLRTGGIIEFIDENDFYVNGTDVGFDLYYGFGGFGLGSLWSKFIFSITFILGRKFFCSYRNDSFSSFGSVFIDFYFGGGIGGSVVVISRLADYSFFSFAFSFAYNGNNNNNGNGYIYVAGEVFVFFFDGCSEL